MNQNKMGISSSIFFSSLLVFLFVFSSSSSANILDDLRQVPSDFASIQAKKLIRQLNLFPGADVNIVRDGNSSVQTKKIVERPLRFPNLVASESGVSVEDLGHHAGYYTIEHSHAAKYGS